MTTENPDLMPTGNSSHQPACDEGLIAAQLNQTLATESMAFEASLDEQILKITVKSDQLLEADILTKSIRDELLKLKLAPITSVHLYKQKLRRSACYKLSEFTPTKEVKSAPTQPVLAQSEIGKL